MTTLQRETASQIPVRFCLGDDVEVLNAIRLPKVEQSVHRGVIERITASSNGEAIYWVTGRAMGLSARVLRLVRRAR